MRLKAGKKEFYPGVEGKCVLGIDLIFKDLKLISSSCHFLMYPLQIGMFRVGAGGDALTKSPDGEATCFRGKFQKFSAQITFKEILGTVS